MICWCAFVRSWVECSDWKEFSLNIVLECLHTRCLSKGFNECSFWSFWKSGLDYLVKNVCFGLRDLNFEVEWSLWCTWKLKLVMAQLTPMGLLGHGYPKDLVIIYDLVEPRWIPSIYTWEITPYIEGMFLEDDDLKGFPLTLGAYSNIGKDQPYTRGKFCGWMWGWFISERIPIFLTRVMEKERERN